jgi:hypothetical protein
VQARCGGGGGGGLSTRNTLLPEELGVWRNQGTERNPSVALQQDFKQGLGGDMGRRQHALEPATKLRLPAQERTQLSESLAPVQVPDTV